MNEVRKFFGYKTVKEFAIEWRKLTKEDKEELTQGILNGSLTY